MATQKYESQPVELEVEIDPTTPTTGKLTVSARNSRIIFVAKREALERLSLQLSEQLTQAPLSLGHR
jgi:hypothetical protein